MKNDIELHRRKFGIALLILLLWVAAFAILTQLFRVSYVFAFFHPFAFLEPFLLQFTPNAWIVILLLALLPLAGWLLLRFEKPIGKFLILASQIAILACNAIVTPLHLLNGMGYYNATGGRAENDFSMTLLLCLFGAVYPIAALILFNKWKPKIK